MSGRWQVVRLHYDGAVRVQCTHKTELTAGACKSARDLWRDITDPQGRYIYDVRRRPHDHP